MGRYTKNCLGLTAVLVTAVLNGGCGEAGEAGEEAPLTYQNEDTGEASAELVGSNWTAAAQAPAYTTRQGLLLPDGRVFAVSSSTWDWFTGNSWGHGLYSPGTDSWAYSACFLESAIPALLPSGKVMLSGGWMSNSGQGSTANIMVCDPVTDTYAWTSGMTWERYFHTATTLQDGRVLLVGGGTNWSGWNNDLTEIFDPSTLSTITVAPANVARIAHTATLLNDGRVLVTGGYGQGPWNQPLEASAEIYDPVADTWVMTTPMATAREEHSATLLPSGKVLVTTGQPEVYDPVMNTWTPTGPAVSTARITSQALLPNGHVLAAGGSGNGVIAQLYDPGTNTWTQTNSLPFGSQDGIGVVLQDGRMLVGGGSSSDPNSRIFTMVADGGPCNAPGDCVSGQCSANVCVSPGGPCAGNNYANNNFVDATSMGGPMIGVDWVPAASSTLTTIEVFTGEVAAPNQLAIWSDNGGSPGQPAAVLAYTASFTTSLTNGWQGAVLNVPLSVTAGTKYWVVWDPAGGEQASISQDVGDVQQNYWGSSSGTVTGGASWFGPFTGSDHRWKFRMFCGAGPCEGNNYANDNFVDATSMGGPLVAIQWVPASGVSVSRIEMFTGEVAGSNQVGLWSDNAGAPFAPLAYSAAFTTSTTNGWQGADLNASVPVVPGTTYWVVWDPAGGEQASISQDVTDIQQSYWASFSGTVSGGASWFGPFSSTDHRWKFKMFCGGGGGCGPDGDGDSVCDATDNCPSVSNANQLDGDSDGLGDLCDNCPSVYNPSQLDTNSDGVGLACETACFSYKRAPGSPAGSVLDTHITTDPLDPTRAGTNFGTGVAMNFGTVGTAYRQGLIRFDVTSNIPSTAIVLSSTMNLRKVNSLGPGAVSVYQVLAPWTESTVTWSSFAGAFGGAALATFTPQAIPGSGYANVDLTTVTQAWVSGASANNGVLLDQPGGSRSAFAASEGPFAIRPTLDVCFMWGE
jgi:hypothetical protein